MNTAATPYALLVRFTLRQGAETDFDALVSHTVSLIQEHEPKTLAYVVHHTDVPAERVFYELYHCRDAFDVHEQQPYIREFLAERGPLLACAPEVTELIPAAAAWQHDTPYCGVPVSDQRADGAVRP
ncbi:quinol monooxygenase YgiN [Streptomyces sp. SLBN-118]|uniref:putative quinol monooxygenase n=1 Tax=Streptomyces sp. SLBN-118 TaxID=2768454 RepID=UPI0011713848|nr:antibiotic biosynthesis monooxygenase [Streptomyces sp. SLBN-118]TQK51248.1 quinol monooxygenase YgiN [Streptomyces sp. SLBN-118]